MFVHVGKPSSIIINWELHKLHNSLLDEYTHVNFDSSSVVLTSFESSKCFLSLSNISHNFDFSKNVDSFFFFFVFEFVFDFDKESFRSNNLSLSTCGCVSYINLEELSTQSIICTGTLFIDLFFTFLTLITIFCDVSIIILGSAE